MSSTDKNEMKFVARLDTDPFIKSAESAGKKVEKALSLKEKTNDKIITNQISKLEDLQSQGEKTYNALIEKTLEWAKTSGVKSADKMLSYAKGLPEFKQYLDNLTQQEAKADSINNRYDNIIAKAKQAADEAQRQADAEQKVVDATEQQAKAQQQATDSAKAFEETTQKAGDAESQIEGIKNELDGVSQSAKEAGSNVEASIQTINKTPVDVNADLSKMSILELVNYIQQAKEEMKLLEKEAKKTPPSDAQNERYNELGVSVERAKGHVSTLKKEFKDMAKTAEEGESANKNFADSFKSFSDAFISMSQADGLVGKLKSGIASLGTTSLFAGMEAQQALTMATAGINLVVEVVTRLLTIVQTVFNALKTLASAIISAFKKVFDVIKKVGEAIKDNIVKLANKAKSSFADMFSFSGSDMRRTLQMLTKYIFGVRSFFFLYRKLRSAVKEGLENLVQFESASNETNHAITELRTSLLYLKNAWAAAFAPIINVVYPILVRFLDLLASIGNAIARFVGALTGQSTVLQALKVDAGDYADSLKNAAGGASKASKAQEDLNDRLAAFDDLNVLGVDDDKTKTPTGGGGGGGLDDLDPNSMFERVKVKMDDFMRQLREAWLTGDGFELGQTIADAINRGLENAHTWLTGEGRDKIQKIANLISTTLDGMLSDPNLASNLGQVLADLFSDAMLFINTVITPERMYMIGVRFAQMLNTAIPQILPELGETIGNLFRSAISNAWGFISTADFAEWGKSFGDAINNFFQKMSGEGGEGGKDTLSGWQLLGMSVTEWAKKILDFFINVVNEVDWFKVGEAIGDFLGNIDVNSIKGGLSKLFETIKLAFSEFTSGLGDFNIFSSNNSSWSKGKSSSSSLLPAMFTALYESISVLASHLPEWIGSFTSFIEGLKWDKVSAWISELPDKFDRLLTVIERFAEVALPILERFGEMFLGLGENASEGLGRADRATDNFANIWNTFRNTTPMGFISPVIAPWFTRLANDLIEGADALTDAGSYVADGVNEETTLFESIRDTLASAWESTPLGGRVGETSPFGFVVSEIRSIVKGADEEMNNLRNVFKITSDKIKGDMVFDTVTDNLKNMVTTSKGYLNEIPAKFTEMKGVADTQSANMKGTYNTTFDSIKSGSIDSAKVVQDNFLLASDTIKDSFINTWAEIKKSISEGGDMFVALSDGMGNTVKSLLNAMIAGINVSITKPLQDISKSFNVLRTLDVNGKKPFAGIPYLNVPTIPLLAQGAVLPPNNPFLAVVGDQTSGTNIEAPLDTIKTAVGDELAPYLEQLIEINRQVINAINKKPVINYRDIGKGYTTYVNEQNMMKGSML